MATYQFPGTDFHDANLDWVIDQVKNCLTQWAATREDWEQLRTDNAAFVARIEEEWESVHTFIDNYFATLDVSEEISEKIDQMATDGSLLEVIAQTVQTSSGAAATAWMQENISQETGYVIDASLSVTGAAADAKAAGDGIRSNTGDIYASALPGLIATDAIIWPTNLANTANATSGYRIDTNGNIIEASTYRVSDYCLIKPNTTYINRTSSTRLNFYTANKTFISSLATGTTNPFTTPANATYFRLSTNVIPGFWQISEGETLPEITPFVPLVFNNNIINPTPESVSPYYHGAFLGAKSAFVTYYKGSLDDYGAPTFNRNTKYADVIAAYDALMADSNGYITKTTLGVASGTDDNGDPYTIYAYQTNPKVYTTQANRRAPIVLLTSCLHGFEKNSAYAIYYLLKDLVEHGTDNPALVPLRAGVTIKIIPVANPYGFDHNTYKNANEVNINRNFDHPGDWEVIPSGADQNGLAPFDQPESAIIRDWILATDNPIFLFDCHTNGQYYASGYPEANANVINYSITDSYFKRLFDVIANQITTRTAIMPKDYNINTNNAFIGKVQATAHVGGVSGYCVLMQNILSFTLETFNGISVNDTAVVTLFSAQSKKMCSEIIGNMILGALNEYIPE